MLRRREAVVELMTGGGGGGGRGRGRGQRRRKALSGGRDATESKEIEISANNNECPSSASEITEIPSNFPNITKSPPTSPTKFDFYNQALKALSFRSPYASEDSQACPPSVSGANDLPSELTQLLSRHSDRRKRHKSHSGSEKKSSDPVRPHGGHIWIETEEYFRDLTVEDVERLGQVSGSGLSGNEKSFMIPCLGGNDDVGSRYNSFNRLLAMACENERLNMANGAEINSNEKVMAEEMLVEAENGTSSMDMDCDEGEIKELLVVEENNAEEGKNKKLPSTSGVEWLLGSRSKIYLASERPSKKRKLLSRDAGLKRILVARPVTGLNSVCHYCSYGDPGDPLNCLIKCSSCGVLVHQRCYGVHDDISSSWLCSWCKWKNSVGLSTNRPCLLCPKQGGALKPVQKRCIEGGDEEPDVEFAHLFCCQWMLEAYVENTWSMEPIMVLDELEARMKMNCTLCKVKYGACVQCTKGTCRVSFHPICAREAGYKMEIWGKLGSAEVELHAFCFKHSEVQQDDTNQNAGDISSAADVDLLKLNDTALDGEDLLDRGLVYRNENEGVSSCSDLNLNLILKKLIDLGKVDAKDLASEIGISHNALNRMLYDNHMASELLCKLVKWLQKHVHISSLQKTLKMNTSSLVAQKPEGDVSEGASAVSAEPDIPDVVPVKSVPPRRRTKGKIRIVRDDKPTVEKNSGETTEMLIDSALHQVNSASDSLRTEALAVADEVSRDLTQCHSEDGLSGDIKLSEEMTTGLLTNGESVVNSYVHPFIYSKLIQKKNGILELAACYESAGLRDREVSQLGASSSSGLCCRNYSLRATSGHWISECKGENLEQLTKTRLLSKLKLLPEDEVEGELIYYQQRLLWNSATRKRITDDLMMKVVKSLPQEIDAAGKRKWDAVLVSQYNHELKEIKKQGRKERRHKEAQAILAAATAAAASSSRVSSFRKDILGESAQQENFMRINFTDVRPRVYSQLNTRVKEAASASPAARTPLDTNTESFQFVSDCRREHTRTCDVCWRSEAVLNPVLVCSSCKVAVHLDCYRSVESSRGPWYCELCEDLFYSKGSGTSTSNSWEKPSLVAECGLCGGTAGAFRKSVNGQWIHALCAEWVLETTYRRGQVNPIQGMETINKGADTCIICHRNQGVCVKCSYGHCRSTFHPTCARSAGLYMTVRTNSGKLQHKSYCEKHSVEQRAKSDSQRHGIEEFKSLKQVRVELERLRLLCERIIKREKLKRELVICSHDVLASSRDSMLSALARHPYYQRDISSESATTSIQGYTDGYKSGSEIVQRSDDITVDSTVAGKRRVKISIARDNNQKSANSSTSQSLYMLKPVERVSCSGKQIPQRFSIASLNAPDNVENHSKYSKNTETFEKELVMTSDQASIKNQRLPKGFVYVPIQCISKEKETVPDACS